MKCSRITFYNFRNAEHADIPFRPDINVLLGENAQGKTNLLEGIYLMAQARSFRPGKEKDLIRFGEDMAGIKLWFDAQNGEQTLEMRLLSNGRRQCWHNGVPVRHLSEFIGHFRAVIFCPEHLSIVKEGPSVRRSFADMALSQLNSTYLHTLQEYAKILNQRNAVLRNCRECNAAFAEMIDPWSVQLAERAYRISEQREIYLQKLQTSVSEIFSDMTSGKEKPQILYSERKTEEEYLRLLRSNLDREVRQMTTLYGTHRDDYAILLNGKEARLFASQGQQRSLALAMKLSEGEISRQMSGEYPVFLLDDIFSELDAHRRSYIMNGLEGRQVIITACDGESYDPANVFRVQAGNVTPPDRKE